MMCYIDFGINLFVKCVHVCEWVYWFDKATTTGFKANMYLFCILFFILASKCVWITSRYRISIATRTVPVVWLYHIIAIMLCKLIDYLSDVAV